MAVEHAARRIYKRSGLLQWLRRAAGDWQKAFRPEELEYGGQLYKQCVVRDLELHEDEALARARLSDGSEPFCVLDFDGDTFVRRAKGLEQAALCVATFYEIDELVGDVLSTDEFLDFDDAAAKKLALPKEEEPAADAESEAAQNAPESAAREPMVLELSFASRRRGLVFSTRWLAGHGRRKNAYGDRGVPVADLLPKECELLLSLAGLARKAGFRYDGQFHTLSELSKIPPFLNIALPKWEKIFKIVLSPEVELLKGGERTLNLVPEAVSAGGGDFDVKWLPSVGGESIDAAELPKLVGGAGSLRIIPEYGILRVSRADTDLVRNVEKAREFGFESGKIPRYMLLSLADFGGKLKMTPELERWRDSLENPPDTSPLPDFLRNYQSAGVRWAMNLFEHSCNAMIADEMGLGKTVQTLTIINAYLEKSPDAKFLVVCPASVIPVWRSETQKFFPKIRTAVLGAKSDFSKADLLIASYTQLRRNRAKIEKIPFELAVLDEAQFIKNPDAKTTLACMAISAKRKIALTGTPVENKLMDIWTAFRWLMPGLLGTRANFARLAAGDAEAVATVRTQISPFVLRRMKNQVAAELPEKVEMDLLCPMSELQKSEYAKLLVKTRDELDAAASDARGRLTVLSLLTRLRQAACDAALLPWIGGENADAGGKISVLADKVGELFAANKKVLVFSQFAKFLDLIESALGSIADSSSIYKLTGATRERSAPVEAFQSAKGGAVMLVSLRAGGTGITLSQADYIFLADPWWNPAVEEQAIARAHRIGRRGDVFVYRMIAGGTVEERVRALQKSKKKLFEDLVGGLKDVSDKEKFVKTIAELL